MPINNPNPNDSHWRGLFSERVSGVILLIGSSIEGYGFILTPLLQATYHVQSINCWFTFITFISILFGYGLIFTIFGKRASRALFRSPKQPSKLGSIVLSILVWFGIQVTFWMRSFLEEHGYSISRQIPLVDTFTR
jgi:hypothetical protein